MCRLLCTPGDPLALLRHTQSPRLSCCPLQPVLVPVQQSGTAAARESFVCGARSLLLVTACNSWKCGTAVRSPERNGGVGNAEMCVAHNHREMVNASRPLPFCQTPWNLSALCSVWQLQITSNESNEDCISRNWSNMTKHELTGCFLTVPPNFQYKDGKHFGTKNWEKPPSIQV